MSLFLFFSSDFFCSFALSCGCLLVFWSSGLSGLLCLSVFLSHLPISNFDTPAISRVEESSLDITVIETSLPLAPLSTLSRPMSHHLTLEHIFLAARRIKGHVRHTPCHPSARLSKLLNSEVFMKMENMQHTGAYKERGALNKLLSLSAEEKAKGVFAASAGNHAQGKPATCLIPFTSLPFPHRPGLPCGSSGCHLDNFHAHENSDDKSDPNQVSRPSPTLHSLSSSPLPLL